MGRRSRHRPALALLGRRALAGVCLGACAAAAVAQSNWRVVAVPVYGLTEVARGEARALAARADRFEQAGRGLAGALASHCSGAGTGDASAAAGLAGARARWADATTAWDALAALSTGPLVERRSARQIDFMPTRPALLAQAVAAAPASLAELERIGAPARGFPALEWLLWPPALAPAIAPAAAPLPHGTPACAYAALLGADIAQEAQALAGAAQARVTLNLENEAALAALVDTVNQWVGGAEQLRWAWLRKPLDVAATRGAAPDFPRQASGQTAASWAARWLTLRDTAVLGARPVPVPGDAAVPFETLLRGRGLNPLADRLADATQRADLAMRGLRVDDTAGVRAAAAALGELTALVQEALAPALGVRLGFSDADGD